MHKYGVIFEQFAERHYVKSFEKKYRGAWAKTRKGLEVEFALLDVLFQKSIAETIVQVGELKIAKVEFKIAGTEMSRHASGNRCIVASHGDVSEVRVLLVYCKTDVRGSRETEWWKSMIRDNYPQYSHLV